MARIVLDDTEIEVSESVEEILAKIVSSRDGLRLGGGAIVAPAGWLVATALGSDDQIYVQVARIGCVRGD
jgi:hypothetical protein